MLHGQKKKKKNPTEVILRQIETRLYKKWPLKKRKKKDLKKRGGKSYSTYFRLFAFCCLDAAPRTPQLRAGLGVRLCCVCRAALMAIRPSLAITHRGA